MPLVTLYEDYLHFDVIRSGGPAAAVNLFTEIEWFDPDE